MLSCLGIFFKIQNKKVKMSKLTISLDEDELKILKKRAKKNFLTIREQVEDIIRRSCINAKNNSSSTSSVKCDDKLVEVFSRDRRGRKKKKVKK